jgi:ketosteroid isomerase-like protein
MGTALDVVNRFYTASNTRDASQLADLVSDDVTFVGPLMQARGAAEYLAMNERLLRFHQETTMLRQFEDGDQVCSLYELGMRTPSGSLLTFLIADWIEVQQGRVATQRLFFDPRAFAQAFAL